MFLHVNPHSYISLKPRVRVKRVLFSVVVVGFVLSVGVRKNCMSMRQIDFEVAKLRFHHAA